MGGSENERKRDLPFNRVGGVAAARKDRVPPLPGRRRSSGRVPPAPGGKSVSERRVLPGVEDSVDSMDPVVEESGVERESVVPVPAKARRRRVKPGGVVRVSEEKVPVRRAGQSEVPVRRVEDSEEESGDGLKRIDSLSVVPGTAVSVEGDSVVVEDSEGSVVVEDFGEVDYVPGWGDEVEEKPREKKSGFRLTPRDIVVIDFFGRYRYGTKVQAARLVGTSEGAINARMLRMGQAGFLRKENVANGKGVWTPTREGLGVADLDFAPIGAGKISLVTMAHTLGLANLGVEVEIGNGEELFGFELDSERVVTERLIASSQQRMKKAREARESDDWVGSWELDDLLLRDEEYDPRGDSPENVPGNESLYVLSSDLYKKDHVPDMVIPMVRGDDGFARNIAVELELSPKHHSEWKRILLTYMESDVFGRVVYFTHKKSIANALLGIADGIGMSRDKIDVRRYTPTSEHLIWG